MLEFLNQILSEIPPILKFVIFTGLAAVASAFLVSLLYSRVQRYGAYAYSNARIKAMLGHIFRGNDLNPLVKSRDLQALVSLLEDSHYSPYLEGIEEFSPLNMEMALWRYLGEVYSRITKISPDEIEDIFSELERIRAIENIKIILIGKFAGFSPESIESELLPKKFLSERVIEQAIEANSFKEAVNAFEETEFWDIINESLTEFEETGSLLHIWFGLERNYWEGVWRRIRVSNASGSDVMENAVGMKIDIMNIMTVLRCKSEGVDPSRIEEFIIPIYYKLEERDLKGAMEADDAGEAVALLEDTEYGESFSEAMNEFEESNSVYVFERALEELHLKKLRALAIQNSTGAGPLIAFFHEKQFEVKNIITIVNGKSENKENEEIREKLVIPGVKG